MEKCSIVVPCYNEEEAIPLFYEATEKATKDMPVEIEYVFVNDGSRDNTLEVMRNLSESDSKVHYVSFSRNFGKEAAMFAGINNLYPAIIFLNNSLIFFITLINYYRARGNIHFIYQLINIII